MQTSRLELSENAHRLTLMPHFHSKLPLISLWNFIKTLMVVMAGLGALAANAQQVDGQTSSLGQVFQGSAGAALPGFVRREPQPLGVSMATEPGHVLVIWDDAANGIAGLKWLQDNYQLQPAQAVKLDALGAAVALFVLDPPENAAKLAAALANDQPGWWVVANARYTPAPPKLPLTDPMGLVGGAVDETTPSFLAPGDTLARYPAALPLGKHSRLVSVLRVLPKGESVSNTYTVLRGVDALATEGFTRIHLAVKSAQDPVIERAVQAFANKGVQILLAP